MEESFPFTQLPREIQVIDFFYKLTPKQAGDFCRTNKEFSKLCQDRGNRIRVWRNYYSHLSVSDMKRTPDKLLRSSPQLQSKETDQLEAILQLHPDLINQGIRHPLFLVRSDLIGYTLMKYGSLPTGEIEKLHTSELMETAIRFGASVPNLDTRTLLSYDQYETLLRYGADVNSFPTRQLTGDASYIPLLTLLVKYGFDFLALRPDGTYHDMAHLKDTLLHNYCSVQMLRVAMCCGLNIDIPVRGGSSYLDEMKEQASHEGPNPRRDLCIALIEEVLQAAAKVTNYPGPGLRSYLLSLRYEILRNLKERGLASEFSERIIHYWNDMEFWRAKSVKDYGVSLTREQYLDRYTLFNLSFERKEYPLNYQQCLGFITAFSLLGAKTNGLMIATQPEGFKERALISASNLFNTYNLYTLVPLSAWRQANDEQTIVYQSLPLLRYEVELRGIGDQTQYARVPTHTLEYVRGITVGLKALGRSDYQSFITLIKEITID